MLGQYVVPSGLRRELLRALLWIRGQQIALEFSEMLKPLFLCRRECRERLDVLLLRQRCERIDHLTRLRARQVSRQWRQHRRRQLLQLDVKSLLNVSAGSCEFVEEVQTERAKRHIRLVL